MKEKKICYLIIFNIQTMSFTYYYSLLVFLAVLLMSLIQPNIDTKIYFNICIWSIV